MKKQNAVLMIFLLVFIVLLATLQKTRERKVQPISIGQLIYQGDGFSLRYPANARLDTVYRDDDASLELSIRGPYVSIKPGYEEWLFEDHSYELHLSTYENPKGADADEWAREYLLDAWRAAKEKGEPAGFLPVADDGTIDDDETGMLFVAEQFAFWVNFFAGDAIVRNFFLAKDDLVVRFSFHDYPLANQPLAYIQQDVYSMIMGTFLFATVQ